MFSSKPYIWVILDCYPYNVDGADARRKSRYPFRDNLGHSFVQRVGREGFGEMARHSALTGWTVERRAAALHDALDRAFAVAGAGLAFTVVDLEVMLKIAELAIRTRIVAQ